ncbi:interleukin-21 receptor isoform 1-T1 [Aulostomus maculatus]
MLIQILLASANIFCLNGNSITDGNLLNCVNDYVVTINCSLSITASRHCRYWLTFTHLYRDQTNECMLVNTDGHYFCSVTITSLDEDDYDYTTLVDTDVFAISLCKNLTGRSCKQLDGGYKPVEHIKPKSPCCLTVHHNQSQHRFTWKSTYEDIPFSSLKNSLQYQLLFYQTHHNVTQSDIITNNAAYSQDDDDDNHLVPDTDYTARVRSRPVGTFYKGQWSGWSSEVHWRTEAPVSYPPVHEFVSRLGIKVLIPLCVVALLLVIFCYAQVKKWRKSAFIPTPAPYFQTLYSECQGDFKSWVDARANTTEVPQPEETFHIETLTKFLDAQEGDCPPQGHRGPLEGSMYTNINGPVCDSFLLGTPYAVTTISPLSTAGSSKTLSFQSGSPAEGDSGCWLCSDTSTTRDPPWYCNEYCTLSSFLEPSLVSAKPCATEIVKVDADTRA